MTFPAAASMRTTSPKSMFSLRTIFKLSSCSWRSDTAATPLSMMRFANASASALKASLPATKSVSHFSFAIAPTLPRITKATTPWLFSRSSRFALAARPFSRSHCLASSILPLFSSSAFLQSIMPAPVESRRVFTSLAVYDIRESGSWSRCRRGCGDGFWFNYRCSDCSNCSSSIDNSGGCGLCCSN